MRVAGIAFDTVQTLGNPQTLPRRLELAPSGNMTMARALLLVPAMLALLAPTLAAVMLIERAGPATMLAESPLSLIALALQPVLWLALAVLAVRSVVPRIGRRRRVRIGGDAVHVAERTLGGVRRWREPLRNFRGIAHHVRATLGGTHHEIVLVHPDPERSVLLISDRLIPQSRIEAVAALLRQPQIPARELYPLPQLLQAPAALLADPALEQQATA
jgi:hypothetical protein